MNKKTFLFFVIFGLFSLSLIHIVSPLILPFTVDSVSYMSAAGSILKGQGLMTTNFALQPVHTDHLPLQFFPPGYSILIFLLSSLGLSIFEAAVWVPRIAFVFLPLAFFLVLRSIVKEPWAMIVALGCAYMAGVIKFSLLALSDIVFLLFILLSLAAMNKAIKSEKGRVALMAGLLGGFAMLVRHTGLPLAVATVVGLGLGAWLRIFSLRKALILGINYFVGWGIIYLPYLVRNYKVFGSIQPYTMPASELSLSHNIRDFLNMLSTMLFGNAQLVIILLPLAAVLVVFLMVRLMTVIKTDYHNPKKEVYSAIIFTYGICGSIFLILARTRFWGAEPIGERYVVQYAWIMLAALIYFVEFLVYKFKAEKKILVTISSLVLIIGFMSVQYLSLKSFVINNKTNLALLAKVNKAEPHLKQFSKDDYMISNVCDIAQVKLNRNVRMLNGYTPKALVDLVGPQRNVVVLLLEHEMYKYQTWQSVFSGIIPTGFKPIYIDQDIAVLYLGR